MLEREVSIELRLVYERLKDETGFPGGYCWEISKRLETWGYLKVSGFFKLDKPISDGVIFEPHGWNVDNEGRIIDMTGSQFNEGLDTDTKVPEGIIIIDKDNPLYSRYCLQME